MGQKFRADGTANRKIKRDQEQHRRDSHRGATVHNCRTHPIAVVVDQPLHDRVLPFPRASGKHHAGHHRRHHNGEEKRADQSKRYRPGHGLEQTALDRLQREDRQVGRDDDAARVEHRPQHLIRRLADPLAGGARVILLRQVAHNVLNHDHRAIDHHAEIQCAQRKQVGGNMADVQADGGKHQRKRDGERDDDGAAYVAQEQKQNDRYQDHAFAQVVLHGLHREGHQLGTIEERNNFHAPGQNTVVQLFYFFMNAFENGVRIVALLQQHNAFHGIGIVNDPARARTICNMHGAADLAKANLGALRHCGDFFDGDRRAVPGLHHRVFYVLHAGVEALGLHVDLLRALLNKAAAAVGVVVGDLLLHLADAQTVGHQLVGIELDLVFLGRTAEARHIHNANDALERLLYEPVFQRLLLHHVIGGVGAFECVPVDLAHGAPVGAHLRSKVRGQAHLAEALEHMLAIHIALRVVVEDQHQAGEAG